MFNIWSHWNTLDHSGLTLDKQNQQRAKEEWVRLLSKITRVKLSNIQKADETKQWSQDNGKVHWHCHESLDCNLRGWLVSQEVKGASLSLSRAYAAPGRLPEAKMAALPQWKNTMGELWNSFWPLGSQLIDHGMHVWTSQHWIIADPPMSGSF